MRIETCVPTDRDSPLCIHFVRLVQRKQKERYCDVMWDRNANCK